MKVYISGPITYGDTRLVTDAVRAQFTLAASRVHGAGDQPVNPLDLNLGETDLSWPACMKRGLAAMLDCDAIYLLPGWEQSRGASREAMVAAEIGMRLWTPEVLDTATHTDPYRKNGVWHVPPRPEPWGASSRTAAAYAGPSWTPDGPPADDPAPGGPPQDEDPAPVPLPFARAGEGTPMGMDLLPSRAYPDDAGMDLYVTEDVFVRPGKFVDIHCHVAVELPPHVWALVIGRSSTLRRRGLMVNPGIIDPGYRGELFTGVWNLGEASVEVKAGERLAQLILFQNVTARYEPKMVDQIGSTDRGAKGFGSSGQ